MIRARQPAIGWAREAALGVGLLLAGGCGVAPARGQGASAPAAPPVALGCERTADSVLRVTARNRTGRPLELDLLGLAYAGQGLWDHWWTQRAVRLAPHGTWSALFYIYRIEKIEARDRLGRLLAAFDVSKLPDHHWDLVTALDRGGTWRPFEKAELLGQRAVDLRLERKVTWRVLPPAELPRCWADMGFLRPRVIGDAHAADFAPEQLEGLRGQVVLGRTVIVCGGADLERLRGWERAGMLAAPVHGTRRLPGLSSLAQRYGVAPVAGPIPVAEVGEVAAPARVALAEGGVPLVVERPLGSGTLFLTTFDPTRPPFRGSALERPFWQEWLGREALPSEGFAVALPAGAAYRQVQRRLRLEPLSREAMAVIWLGYLTALLLVLRARRRLAALAALSAAGSLAALALGPLLHSTAPAAAYAAHLDLASGESEGWWWGRTELMLPASRAATVRIPHGWTDSFWESPRIRPSGSPDVVAQPLLRRWVPEVATMDAPVRLPGSVQFDLEIDGNDLYARVRNRMPQPLRDLAVVWDGSISRRLGDLAPGQEVRRLVARAGRDGDWTGIQGGVPGFYGQVTPFRGGASPRLVYPPELLAHCPAPAPGLSVDGRPVTMDGVTALVVQSSGFRVKGAFHLPRAAVTARLVGTSRPGTRGALFQWGTLMLWPGDRVTYELQLPAGAGRALYSRADGHSLDLLLERDVSLSAGLSLFDWTRQAWVQVAALQGHAASPPLPPQRFVRRWIPAPSPWSTSRQSIAVPFPERFVNSRTDTLLLRIENSGAEDGAVGMVGATGDGQAR